MCLEYFLMILSHAAKAMALATLLVGQARSQLSDKELKASLSAVPVNTAKSPDIHLNARLDTQKNQLYVALRNDGSHTYLLPMGELFQFSRSENLSFALLREKLNPEPLVLSFDGPGVIGGKGSEWIVVVTPGTEYGFSFPLQSLRLQRDMRTSVADLRSLYALQIDFRGIDPNSGSNTLFIWNWPHKELEAAIPFWQGKVTVKVKN